MVIISSKEYPSSPLDKFLKTVRDFYDEELSHIDHIGSILFLLVLTPFYIVYLLIRHSDSMNSIIVAGVVQGAFYALIAVGFAIIFGISRMFKLSIGGYFVAGAFSAFWLNKVFYQPYNTLEISSYSGIDLIYFSLIKYLPMVLFFVLLVGVFWILDRKYAIIVVVLQLLTFIIQREIMVSNYGAFNFEATFLAINISLSVILAGYALFYIELSKNQILGSIVFLNLLSIILNILELSPRSPGVYLAILLMSVIFVASAAMLVDRYILDDVRENATIVLIITFGIALLIQSGIPLLRYPENGAFLEIGIDPKNLDGIVPKVRYTTILGYRIQTIRVIAAMVSVFVISLIYYFINDTPTGRAMEAVAEDPEAAWLVGINVRKIYLISTGIGMGLAAMAGVLTSPYNAIPYWGVYMGWTPLIFAIAVVTLGGIGSIFGAAVAGFILGLTESTVASSDPQLSRIVPLLAIFVIIILRPNGLFGVEEDE